MPNDVFRAIDATLVLGVEDTSTPEGEAANTIVSDYDLSNLVGRLQNVSISIFSDIKPFYEIGRRYPTHLRPGKVSIQGCAERAHVNGALLKLLMGDGASNPPGSPIFTQPSFNMIATLRDNARPDQHTRVTAYGVKFENWSFHIPKEDFVMETAHFQAMRIAFEEA